MTDGSESENKAMKKSEKNKAGDTSEPVFHQEQYTEFIGPYLLNEGISRHSLTSCQKNNKAVLSLLTKEKVEILRNTQPIMHSMLSTLDIATSSMSCAYVEEHLSEYYRDLAQVKFNEIFNSFDAAKKEVEKKVPHHAVSGNITILFILRPSSLHLINCHLTKSQAN